MMVRPKGYAEWRPTRKVQKRVDTILRILDEYERYWPLTVRQVYYRVIGLGYPKGKETLWAVQDVLTRGRRAGLIPFSAIRDDGAVAEVASHAPSDTVEDFWDNLWAMVRSFDYDVGDFQLNPLDVYPRHIEVWTEAAGAVPLVQQAVRGYLVTVQSGGGFDSITNTHRAAQRIEDRDKPTVVLHVGDHDWHGEQIWQSAAKDVQAFLDYGEVEFKRLALTDEQIAEYNLPGDPTNPDKVQLEALAPDDLISIVRAGVKAELDLESLAEQRRQQQEVRDQLNPQVDTLEAMFDTAMDKLYDRWLGNRG